MKVHYPLTCLLFVLTFLNVNAQGPGSLFVDAGEDVVIDCEAGGCTDITATYLQTFETISEDYIVSSIPYEPPFAFNGLANQLNPDIDDSWSVVDNLPFDFCFFGNQETQFQVGSNGVLRFDVDPGDTGPFSNNWPFNVNIPNNTTEAIAEANVFTPVHDIDPAASNSEEIGYEVLGTAPNRVLVVSYYRVPLYNCNSLLATHMVVFYEFSNIIEFYIENKPTCGSWNGGNAALGIQNNEGNIGYTPPGRNTSDSPWSTSDEAWRFAPNGTETSVFEWLDADDNVIGTSPTINVCPDGTEVYTARVTYTNTCTGQVVILEDDVSVTSNTPFVLDIGPDVDRCDQEQVLLDAETGNPDVTYRWFRDGAPIDGATDPQYTVLFPDSGTYSCEATDTICTLTDEAVVRFLEQPIANEANDLFRCDDGSDPGEFDLRVNRPLVLGGQDPAAFEVSFHTSQDDANTGANPIMMEMNFPITGTNQIIYARIAELNQVCFDTTSFELSFLPADFSVDLGPDVDRCDQEPVLLDADTGDPEVTYRWFRDGAPIDGATNATYEVLFPDSGTYSCQLTDGVCDLEDEVVVRFLEQPVANEPVDLFQCDDGINPGEFDLSVNRPIVLGAQDPAAFNVSFHRNLADAESGADPILNEINFPITGSLQTIYVRIEELTGVCYDTEEFEIEFSALAMGELTDVEWCDQEETGELTLDLLELKQDEILDGLDPSQFAISFHENQADADTGDSPLDDPYTVELSGERIFVRLAFIENPDCFDTGSFEVIFYSPPLIIEPLPYEVCDPDNDGFEEFELSSKDGEITGGATDVAVTYFRSEEEAATGDPLDVLPDRYTNEEPDRQTIWARASDVVPAGSTRPSCYSITSLDLVVNPVPVTLLEPTYRLCLDEFGRPIPQSFGDVSPPLLDTGLNPFEYTFYWTLDGQPLADDQDPDQPETDPWITALAGGNYEVEVTDRMSGCSSSARTEVTISSPPFFYNAQIIGEPFSGNYSIEVTAQGEGTYEYSLDGGAFQDSTLFEDVRRGVRVVTIRSKEGCGEVSLEVTVIDFPKFFTPNQDGFNDTWEIEGLAELDPSATVTIFDRFGKLLRQFSVQGDGWDGVYQGEPLPSSDYWFVIDFTLDGVPRQYRNHFTLKR